MLARLTLEYRNSWTIACRDATDTPSESDEESDEEEEDEEEAKAFKGEDNEDEEPKTSYPKPFADFLGWVSTICPSLPHLTYPLLLVIVSTLPDELLPLEGGPSEPLQSFLTHLWSPMDARLLSTHSLPNQQSAFQAFFQDAVDCTVFLLGKAMRRQDGQGTAEWLVQEQLVGRAWGEGVLDMGAKGGKRRGQDTAPEFEADVFGKALGRIALLDEPVLDKAVVQLRDILVTRCGQLESDDLSKASSSLLLRTPAILSAVRGANDNTAVLAGLAEVAKAVHQVAADGLSRSASAQSTDAPIYAEVLLSGLSGGIVDAETIQVSLAPMLLTSDLCWRTQQDCPDPSYSSLPLPLHRFVRSHGKIRPQRKSGDLTMGRHRLSQHPSGDQVCAFQHFSGHGRLYLCGRRRAGSDHPGSYRNGLVHFGRRGSGCFCYQAVE